MNIPGRKYSSTTGYRYGFNGKENDPEVEGQQDYGMRIYDRRLVRFKSVDPITKKYPELTPYQFASNRPIDGIDLDGLEFFKKDNSNYRMDYYPVVNSGSVMQGVNNVANNIGAFLWNGTLGAALEGSKGINNYFAGGYKEPSMDIMRSFDAFQIQAYKYHTKTSFSQQMKDLGNAATDLRNYEVLPSLVIAHTYSIPKTSLIGNVGEDIWSARRQLANDWNLQSGYVNFNKQVYTQTVDATQIFYQYRIPGTDAGSYFVKSLSTTPEEVGLLSSEYSEVYKVTVNKPTKTLVSTHTENASYWRNQKVKVKGGGQQVYSPDLKNNSTFEKVAPNGN